MGEASKLLDKPIKRAKKDAPVTLVKEEASDAKEQTAAVEGSKSAEPVKASFEAAHSTKTYILGVLFSNHSPRIPS